jgi:hypothetical protein
MTQKYDEGPPRERRRAPRFSVFVPLEYQDHGVAGRGFTKNVSRTGVLIEQASSPVPIGADLRLRFSFFLGAFETPFRGEVVRHSEEGFALQFGSLDEAQLGVLRTALRSDVHS